MIKKRFTLFRMAFLLCAMILGGVSPALAEEETIASFTASEAHSGNLNGWTINGTPNYGTSGGGFYQLTNSDISIVTPSIKWSDYSDITITISARKYGGPNATQGKISVSQGSTELTSYSPSGTSIAASSALKISPNDGTITISCPGASSSKGCGVQSIVIKGTKKSGTSDPSISANDATVSWNAEGGNIEYTISNPLNPEWEQVMLITDTGDNWLQSGSYGSNGELPFTVSTNYGDERSATVTLSYSYVIAGDDTAYQVSTTATVTQTAKPAPIITVQQDSYTMGKDDTSIQIPYSIENADATSFLSVGFDGNANWTSLNKEIDYEHDIITITTDANSGPERTVNVVLGYPGAENKTVTLTQEGVIWPTVSYQANPAEGATQVYCCDASYNPIENGSMVEPGSKVYLMVTPADNYEFLNWTVVKGNIDIPYPTNTSIEFLMPEDDVEIVANLKSNCVNMTIDFESAATAYTDWTFTNIVSNYSNTDVTAHGGSKYGSTDGKASGSIQTKEKVNPVSLTCYVSKQSTNTSTSTWYIHVSSDGSTWTEVANTDAKDMNKGEWKKFTAALSNYSDVYVRVSYSGSTAVRLIDDLTLEIKNDNRAEAELVFEEDEYSVELFNAASFNSPALTNPHELPITWTSSNETVATVNEGTVTILGEGVTTIKASFDGNETYKKGEASYVLTVQDSRNVPTVAIDDSGITNTNVFDGTAAGSLSAAVTYNDAAIEGASVTWSGDNEEVATIDAATGDVTLVAAGTVTFTATYAGNANYKPGEATYEMTVTYSDPNAPGTVNNPYTVAEARAAIDAGTGLTNVYATGIVSQTGTLSNGAISYYISDDGTTTDQLQAYKGKGIGGANFTSADDIQLGDIVVIKGNLKKYNSIYEFDSGNQLVSLDRPIVPTIIVADATINVDASSQGITRGITVNNLTITDADNFHIKYYNANDEEVEKPSWIEEATVTVENSAYVLSCTVAANEGDERTAYLKVYAMNGDETIYSNLVTITQAKYVPDYATLPFEFDGGLNDIMSTSGLTQNGLGSDYASSPKLKFDTTGDYLVLKIDEAPGKLTFDIEGNSFSGGMFKVQTSADGVTFTDLASYTSIGSETETKEFDDLDADVRYIKWIYTSKSSGNVGLGNIKLAKPITDPVIKLAETSVEVDAKQHEGTIALTYKNLQIDDMEDFSVQFFSDEQGTVTTTAPEWVEALVAEQDPSVGPGYVLSYVINANDGAARTAYLRVYANDGVNSVASDVVTITQAKFVKTTTYTLAHSITPGKHYVIASGDVGTVYVMGKQKSTNRDAVYGAEVNFSEVLSVTEDIAADVREFIISKDGNYYTIFDESESGYLFASSTSANHLKTQATNNANGQWTITIDEEGIATLKANMTGRNWMRFNESSKVFSCYSSGQEDIYLFEKDNDEGSLVIPIAAACTDGTNCFGTFSSTKPFVVPEDLTVSEIGINTDGTMNVVNYDAGAVVPANTGVMVSAAIGDRSYVANVSTEVGNNVLNGDNRLRPTGDNGLTATEMTSAVSETCKFYRLTMHNGTDIGFWWGSENGGAFAVAANKAYMVVPADLAGARQGFGFDDATTGISNVNVNENVNGNVYDLQGRKVSTPGKGLYIVNGKKVVIK